MVPVKIMLGIVKFCMLLLLVVLIGPANASELNIVHVSASPKSVSKGEQVTFRLSITAASDVVLNIFDEDERRVYTALQHNIPPGDLSFTWDGTDGHGNRLEDGAYHYTFTASNANDAITWDITEQTGGEPVVATDIHFDPVLNQVNYVLTRRSRLFLRYGLRNGPLLGSLLRGKPRDVGEHVEPWDGTVNGGLVNVGKHPLLEFFSTGVEYSRNVILLLGGASEQVAREVKISDPVHRQSAGTRLPGLSPHAYHRGEICRDFGLKAKLLTAKNTPQLFRIRVDIEERDRRIIRDGRIELRFYLDSVLITENESAFLPYTWNLPAQLLSGGRHLVTVLASSYNGHFGTQTVELNVMHDRNDVQEDEK